MKRLVGILSRMRYRRAFEWLLVLVALAASTVAALLALWLSFEIERTTIRLLASVHLNFPPSDLLDIADLLSALLIAAIWILPVALALGFAMRSRVSVALLWGFSISLLLTATFVWFETRPHPRAFVIAAGAVAIFAIVLLAMRRLPARSILFVEFASFCLLFVPSLYVLASLPRQPPLARKMWSVVLQKGTWQAMNTGSEFAATRQLTFAGGRIVAVFDAGSAGI